MKTKKMTNPFFQEVYNTVHRDNRNALIMMVGMPGKGKSWSCVKMASDLDSTFTHISINERCVFEPKEFTRIVAEGNLKKGSVVMLEEAGVAADAHRWQSFNNRAIKYILQTFRQDNLIVIFNMPIVKYLDSSQRKLFQFILEAERVYKTRKLCKIKVRRIQYNQILDKTYYPRPIYRHDGQVIKLDRLFLKRADIKLIHAYEKLAAPYKERLKKNLNIEVQARERADRQAEIPQMSNDDIINEVIKKQNRYITDFRGRKICQWELIMYDYKIGRVRAYGIKKHIENMIESKGGKYAK